MNLKLILVASLALNLALGAYALRRPAAPLPSPGPVQSPAPAPSAAPVQSVAPEPAAPTILTNTVVRKFTWEQVESPDYKEYIANLRAIGCPDETIRDIIIADVTKLFDEKKRQLRGEPKKFEYWKAGNPMMMALGDPDLLPQMRALDEEKNTVLRALGIEPDFKTQAAQMLNPLETIFDFLPEAKKFAVLKVMTDQQSRMAKAMEGGRPDPAEMAKAQIAMEQAIKQLLTPQEALDFDLRMSMTANIMRSQIDGFDPNAEEFLNVFQLRKAFDDEFNPMLRMDETDEQRQRREAADQQLKEQIRQSLGPERYADYERAQDWNFQQLHRSATRANLGPAAAVQAYEVKRIAEQQAAALRNNQDLTPAARTAALADVRQETERALQQVLGEKGWEQYNQQRNTHWLRNLGPPESASGQ